MEFRTTRSDILHMSEKALHHPGPLQRLPFVPTEREYLNCKVLCLVYQRTMNRDMEGLAKNIAGDNFRMTFEASPKGEGKIPWWREWRGLRGLEKYMHTSDKYIVYDQITPTEFIAQGDIVSASVLVTMKSKTPPEAGQATSADIKQTHRVKFRGGKIESIHITMDTQKVARLFGLKHPEKTP